MRIHVSKYMHVFKVSDARGLADEAKISSQNVSLRANQSKARVEKTNDDLRDLIQQIRDFLTSTICNIKHSHRGVTKTFSTLSCLLSIFFPHISLIYNVAAPLTIKYDNYDLTILYMCVSRDNRSEAYRGSSG